MSEQEKKNNEVVEVTDFVLVEGNNEETKNGNQKENSTNNKSNFNSNDFINSNLNNTNKIDMRQIMSGIISAILGGFIGFVIVSVISMIPFPGNIVYNLTNIKSGDFEISDYVLDKVNHYTERDYTSFSDLYNEEMCKACALNLMSVLFPDVQEAIYQNCKMTDCSYEISDDDRIVNAECTLESEYQGKPCTIHLTVDDIGIPTIDYSFTENNQLIEGTY